MVDEPRITIEQFITRKNHAAAELEECLKGVVRAYEALMAIDVIWEGLSENGASWDDIFECVRLQTPRELIDAYIVRKLSGAGAYIDLDDHRTYRDVPRSASIRMRIKRDNTRTLEFAIDALERADTRITE